MKQLNLSKIFGSNCRTKILEKFLLENESWNNEGFYMRLLSRELWEQINSIKRELDNLNELWILNFREELRKKIFFVNKNFVYTEEFTNIFLKNYNPMEKIKEYFKTQNNLEVVIVNNSVQTKLIKETKSLLDIFLIWEIDRAEFANFLSSIFFQKKSEICYNYNRRFL